MNKVRLLLGTLLLVTASTSAVDVTCEQTIYQAKEIITLESGWPNAKFVVVSGKKVTASANTLEQLVDYNVPMACINRQFAEHVIVPGFIEAHSHIILGGILLNLPIISAMPTTRPDGSEFSGVRNAPQALALIKHYANQFNDPEQTLLIWGWDIVMMGGYHLDKDILNALSPHQPIVVWDSSEHHFFANDAAMAKAKLTKDDLKTVGVKSADGVFSGQFSGPIAGKRILSNLTSTLLHPDYVLPRMKSLLDLSVRNGITTSSEQGMGIFSLGHELTLFRHLSAKYDKARLVVVPFSTAVLAQQKTVASAINWVKTLEKSSNERLIFNGIKFYHDDSFLSLSMMEPKYLDGRQGLYIIKPDALYDTLAPWWKEDVTIHVHSNGTDANLSLVNTLSRLQREVPKFEPQFVVEHFGMTTPTIIQRLAALKGMASVNPYYVYYRSDANVKYVGADRSAKAARLRTMVDTNLITSLHSDTPIGPPDPLEWMWIATNRESLSGTIQAPHERISRLDALKMVTINAAKTLGIDSRVGSIEAGKFADFTILSHNPLTIPASNLRNIDVWGTVVSGKIFHATNVVPNMALSHGALAVDIDTLTVDKGLVKLWQQFVVNNKAAHRSH